jgi:hypothetical protein
MQTDAGLQQLNGQLYDFLSFKTTKYIESLKPPVVKDTKPGMQLALTIVAKLYAKHIQTYIMLVSYISIYIYIYILKAYNIRYSQNISATPRDSLWHN